MSIPGKIRTTLVCMPWSSTARPSLALGLLQAGVRARGLRCDTYHPNLEFASMVGAEAYAFVSDTRSWFALAEHLFAVDIFGTEALDSDRFLAGLCGQGPLADGERPMFSFDTLLTLRDLIVPAFLDQCTSALLDDDPNIVGFSCVFNQVMPSLALARRLKQADAQLTTLLGGACVHGDMGRAYARVFPEIVDHVFTGESDTLLPEFLERFAEGRDFSDMPGIASGAAGGEQAPMVVAMDKLPTPIFDDYFAQREALQLAGKKLEHVRELPYESSRGCWWGAKSHCTFCGLNNEGLSFREKSTDRILAELAELSARYSCTSFSAADNILPHSGYTNLLPRLAAQPAQYSLFYEIKANLSRDDVLALKSAGVNRVQPGVEAFNDHVLKLMRKGVTAAQNIQLLKWLVEHGVDPFYNLLVGFPGETEEDYEEMLALLPQLYHLPAPTVGCAVLAEVHRFSPFFDDPASFGITGTRAFAYYGNLIPPDLIAAEEFAYFFNRDIPADAPIHKFVRALNASLDAWTKYRGRKQAHLGEGFIAITRFENGAEDLTVLGRLESLALALVDAATSRSKVARRVEELLPGAAERIDAAMTSLVASGFAVETGGRIVGVVPFARAIDAAKLEQWVTHHAESTAAALHSDSALAQLSHS